MTRGNPNLDSPISKARSRAMRRAVVVSKVREVGVSSRTELVAETGLSPSTITHVVRELIEEGVLRDIGSGESRGGRRTTLLKFEDSSELVGFIEVKDQDMEIVFAGWHGEVVERRSIASDVSVVADEIRQAMQTLPGALRAICLAVPGIALGVGGAVGLAPALRHLGSESLTKLPDLIDVPVVVDNDVNLILLGEHASGLGGEYQDVALLHVAAEGIGAALMLDGEVRTGAHGTAGEIGFLPLTADGFYTGDMGFFETQWSGEGLRKQLVDIGIVPEPDDSLLRTLLVRAGEGDEAAELLARAVDAWARAVVAIVCLIDPGLVLLSGEIATADDEFIDRVNAQFKRYWPKEVPFRRGQNPEAMLLGGVRRGFATAEQASIPGNARP